MKYGELLEITKEISDNMEEIHKTSHDCSMTGYVIYKDMYSMLERFKKEKKTKIIDPKLRVEIKEKLHRSSEIISLYFRVRYRYLITFGQETQR